MLDICTWIAQRPNYLQLAMQIKDAMYATTNQAITLGDSTLVNPSQVTNSATISKSSLCICMQTTILNFSADASRKLK
jgi:hypothetical protein